MAGVNALLAVEGESAIAAYQRQSQSIVGNAAVSPSLDQRRNVDHHELVQARRSDANRVVVSRRRSQRGRAVVGQRVLEPTVVELKHVELTVGSHSINVHAQRGLAHADSGGQSGETEFQITVGALLYHKGRLRAVILV